MSTKSLFNHRKPVIGMIHLGALPGTPACKRSLADVEKLAVREATLLRGAGVHGLMIENMHDTPYLRGQVGPEIVAAMAIIGRAVKETAKLPCGVQILAGANLEAMAVAHTQRVWISSAPRVLPSRTWRMKVLSSRLRRSCCGSVATSARTACRSGRM